MDPRNLANSVAGEMGVSVGVGEGKHLRSREEDEESHDVAS